MSIRGDLPLRMSTPSFRLRCRTRISDMAHDPRFNGQCNSQGFAALGTRYHRFPFSYDGFYKAFLFPSKGFFVVCMEGDLLHQCPEVRRNGRCWSSASVHARHVPFLPHGLESRELSPQTEEFSSSSSQIQTQVSGALEDPDLPQLLG